VIVLKLYLNETVRVLANNSMDSRARYGPFGRSREISFAPCEDANDVVLQARNPRRAWSARFPGEQGEAAMNQDQFKGVLGQLKGKAKVLWGELTNNEETKADGAVDKLYGTLQQTFGDTKELLKRKLDKIKLP
jgi:uncharacterized protein YjbJ (UPF0337 family)